MANKQERAENNKICPEDEKFISRPLALCVHSSAFLFRCLLQLPLLLVLVLPAEQRRSAAAADYFPTAA